MNTQEKIAATLIAFGASMTVVGLYDLMTHKRLDAMEQRIAVVETNGILSLGMLSRAEQMVGRIEREMRERQQPYWTPIPNLPFPTNGIIQPFYWQQGIMLTNFVVTNIVVTQDVQGNWKVQWPTNKP